MLRLIFPLFALTAAVWAVFFYLHGNRRKQSLTQAGKILLSLGVGGLVLIVISMVFLGLEYMK